MEPEAELKTTVLPTKTAFLTFQLKNDGLFDDETMNVEMIFVRNPESDADVDFYAETMENVYAKNKAFTILFDASGLTSIPLKYLKALKKRMDETAEKQERLMIASAALLPQGSLMKVIQKLFLAKSTSDRRICATIAEAQSFLATF